MIVRKGKNEKNDFIYHETVTEYGVEIECVMTESCCRWYCCPRIYREKRGEDYFITFMEYKSSMRSLANAPKPTFKVTFENMGNQTGITVQFVKGVLQPSPFVSGKNVDMFWEKKLDAKKLD